MIYISCSLHVQNLKSIGAFLKFWNFLRGGVFWGVGLVRIDWMIFLRPTYLGLCSCEIWSRLEHFKNFKIFWGVGWLIDFFMTSFLKIFPKELTILHTLGLETRSSYMMFLNFWIFEFLRWVHLPKVGISFTYGNFVKKHELKLFHGKQFQFVNKKIIRLCLYHINTCLFNLSWLLLVSVSKLVLNLTIPLRDIIKKLVY